MSMAHRAALAARRFGLNVSRWPSGNSNFGAFRALMSVHPATVIDVGANAGQYGLQLRTFGYKGDIVSLEPGTEAFRRLEMETARDPKWECLQVAAGEHPGEIQLNIAANDGASSSFLPMLAAHEIAAPEALYTASEVVSVIHLEDLAVSHSAWKRPALKLDVQGYEREVLAGCGSFLNAVLALRIELSVVPLYDGAWLWRDASDWLYAQGFVLAGLSPGLADPNSGRLLQFDGVFVRA